MSETSHILNHKPETKIQSLVITQTDHLSATCTFATMTQRLRRKDINLKYSTKAKRKMQQTKLYGVATHVRVGSK